MSPIALDARAARRTLVIARPCTGQRVPGAGERPTAQLPEPEISDLLQARVMAAGRGSRAADTVLQHSGAAGAFAAAGASVVAAVSERGGRGGGRRSDIRLKHDVVLLGRLDNGLGYYRFAYGGSEKAYVGVIAQEVRAVRPDAVAVGRDGYLRVSYERLGLAFRSYDEWAASGGRLPKPADPPH